MASDPSKEMDYEFFIRCLYPEDIGVVMDLHRQLFPVRYDVSFFKRLFGSDVCARVLIHRISGQIVGVATARTENSGWFFWNRITTGYVMTFGIEENFRRKGLGRKFFQEFLQELFRDYMCEQVSLHVQCINLAAVQFYSSVGMETKGLLKDHYDIDGVPSDAYYLTIDNRKPSLEQRLNRTDQSLGCLSWIANLVGEKSRPHII